MLRRLRRRTAFARSFHGQAGPARVDNAALGAIAWRGGPITSSSGEVVHVFVSDALPAETPEKWAEFIAGLTHGPELARLTSNIATLAEVQRLCGARALGCYSGDELVSLGEPTGDGTTPEEVVRHEYGHHVAFHRVNTPWSAIDWGPKHWASAATVCPRVTAREAFPGDEGSNYASNPGEAWAEVYRLMDERKAGITTATWPIMSPSFFPDEADLVAAERDVLQPWTANRKTVSDERSTKTTKKPWWISLPTPLDGELVLNVDRCPLPGSTRSRSSPPTGARSCARPSGSGSAAKRTMAGVCGQRTHFVRVSPGGRAGRVTVTISSP